MIEIVTVWAPRVKDKHWSTGYLALLELQAKSVKRVGHEHMVVTDSSDTDFYKRYRTLRAAMRGSLMFAILEGQIAYVEQWDNSHPFVLVDIDCIICRKLEPVFAENKFDVMLTSRENPVSPIQNGAMYFAAGCKPAALAFLRRAHDLCADHWGGDQEAISKAVAPVPEHHGAQERFGARFQFEPTDLYNHSSHAVPDTGKGRFIEHFKGNSKQFAKAYTEDLFKMRAK